MNPISNQPFSHDAIKYVFQTPDPNIVVNQGLPPSKPFELKGPKKSDKSKKDLKKDKQLEKEKKRPFI